MKQFAQYMSSGSYYLGDNVAVLLIGLYVLNLNYQNTVIVALGSYTSLTFFIKNHQYYSALLGDYVFSVAFSFMVGWALSFLDTKASKEKFLAEKKIQRLLIEQRNIFDNMPDGVIIHKNIQNPD